MMMTREKTDEVQRHFGAPNLPSLKEVSFEAHFAFWICSLSPRAHKQGETSRNSTARKGGDLETKHSHVSSLVAVAGRVEVEVGRRRRLHSNGSQLQIFSDKSSDGDEVAVGEGRPRLVHPREAAGGDSEWSVRDVVMATL